MTGLVQKTMNKQRFCRWILIFLIIFPWAAASAAGPDIWLSGDGSLQTDAVAVSAASGNEYTFFLPGGAFRGGSLCFGIADGISFRIGGTEIHTGDSAAMLKPGGSYEVSVNGRNGTLKVCSGSAGLPALFIITESGKLSYIEASKKNRESGRMVLRTSDGTVQYDGELEHIKIRGNSSIQFEKKNYQIKLAKGTDLLGMGKAKKWILTGNYRDKSCLRNMIMLDLSVAVSLRYTPQHAFAELYVNHEYRGLYLFSEKVEISDERVSIHNLEKETEKLNEPALSSFRRIGEKEPVKGGWKAYDIENIPEDITGGYLLEYEQYTSRYADEPSAYRTKRGFVIDVKSPEYVSAGQMEYISSLVQSFENAILNDDGTDPGTGKHYTEIADLESLVLKYMIEEISENYDGNSSSQFFFKPRDDVSTKLFAGPAWDYDSTFGAYATNRSADKVLNPQYLWIASEGKKYAWYPALYRHADFRSAVARAWSEKVRPAVEILLGIRPSSPPLCSIDVYAGLIRDSAGMDRLRWPRRKNPSTIAQTGYTFGENVRYLQDFLQQRYDFLNTVWTADEP